MKESWFIYELSEVTDVGSGNSAPQKKEFFDNGEDLFIRTSDVGKIKIGKISDSLDKLNKTASSKMKLQVPGTILIPKSGASTFLNHRVIMESEGYISSHLASIKANNSLLLDKFLFYFLCRIKAQDLIQNHSYPSLKLSDIKSIKICLPPVQEQKQIVETLDKAFEKIDKAIANIERNIQNAEELFQSKLNQIFTETGNEWIIKKLNEITEVKDGTHDSPKYINDNDGVPFVTQKNILNNGLSFEKVKFISKKDHDNFYKRSNVAFNDILFSMIGANRGMACIVDNNKTFSIKNVGLIKSNDKFLSRFLLYYLKSPIAKTYVNQNSSGSAQGFLSLTKLRSFNIPFTNLNKQSEVVESLNVINDMTKKILLIYKNRLRNLEQLKKSILEKAFKGELTSAA